MTWRELGLKVGRLYEILEDCSSPMDDLQKGDVLIFEKVFYDRYDSASILSFVSKEGRERRYFLHDDSELPDVFVPVEER